MEMQRSLLLMYASCAWFFDDIAGTEAAIALRRAAHAMDLWKKLGGKTPEKAFVEVLAQARSNDPALGSGADAFARACDDRVTAESATARAAFSMLASMASDDGVSPGFTVEMAGPTKPPLRSEIKGKAEITHRRTGERKDIAFSASYDGKSSFVCRMPGKQLGLDDLDDEARQALRFGALVRLAGSTRGTSGCRAFLAVADKLGACSLSEQAALDGLLARVLGNYLENGLRKSTDYVDWSLARELATRASAVQANDDWRRVQETVWEHLEALRGSAKALPQALLDLATRLELVETSAASAAK
jgi:hypothetical protein